MRVGVQPKLKIGAVNDPAEVEADRVADQVMRMPAPANDSAQIFTKANPSDINRKCTDCGDEDKIQRKEIADIRMKETGGTGGHTASAESSSAINSLGSGSPLPASERAFFEPRFGQDLSHIRVHTGGTADAASQSINARAFSLGNNIAFANGQYQPGTQSGRTLMAHEITHTLQGGDTLRRYAGCSTAQDTTINADHTRALAMLDRAISEISSYNGSTPSKVYNALNTHFGGSTSNAFATWINMNLRYLRNVAWMCGYQCATVGSSSWACKSPYTLATTFWCVPGFDVRVCDPTYFNDTATGRSSTLIHEWVHKYGCNFDLGYEHETGDYSGNWTVTQLINADPWANLVRDVQ